MARVLIVDDSAFSRGAIAKMLNADSRISVVGFARNGEEGLKKLIALRPDVITLDLEMPRMSGFELLRLIMRNHPVPVIVVSSQSERQDVFKALELGAFDFIAKPFRSRSSELYSIKTDLIEKVLEATRLGGEHIRRCLVSVAGTGQLTAPRSQPAERPAGIVLIGSSTGGPPALHQLFSALKEKLPVPVVIAQHMPPGFTRSFAQRLDDYSVMDVKEAESGDSLVPGRVLICPGSKNIELGKLAGAPRVRIVEPPSKQIYTPSVNVLFQTGAAVYGPETLAVVLTGMGNDGAAGVEEVAMRDGRVLAEAEESCVVFGMPKEAIKTGRVEKIVPMAQMLAEIQYRCCSATAGRQGGSTGN